MSRRAEGAFRHLLRKKHWPDWIVLTDNAWDTPRCRTCLFGQGPRRPLSPLRYAWAARPV